MSEPEAPEHEECDYWVHRAGDYAEEHPRTDYAETLAMEIKHYAREKKICAECAAGYLQDLAERVAARERARRGPDPLMQVLVRGARDRAARQKHRDEFERG